MGLLPPSFPPVFFFSFSFKFYFLIIFVVGKNLHQKTRKKKFQKDFKFKWPKATKRFFKFKLNRRSVVCI
jgi:hypothetical protein